MSRLQEIQFDNLGEIDEVKRFISIYAGQINSIINGRIQFVDNILSQLVEVKFNSANSDQAILHDLRKTSVNFIVIDKNVSCDIYRGSSDSTTNQIYLRSTVANATVKLLLI